MDYFDESSETCPDIEVDSSIQKEVEKAKFKLGDLDSEKEEDKNTETNAVTTTTAEPKGSEKQEDKLSPTPGISEDLEEKLSQGGQDFDGEDLVEKPVTKDESCKESAKEEKLDKENIQNDNMSPENQSLDTMTGENINALDEPGSPSETLEGPGLPPQNMDEPELPSENMDEPRLSEASLVDSNLEASLSTENMSEPRLVPEGEGESRLTPENITESSLTAEHITPAELSAENFTEARLTAENMTETGLTPEDLTGADLTPGNLTGAELTSENLTDSGLASETMAGTGLVTSNLSETRLTSEDMAGSVLSAENITQTGLTGENMSETGLTGENMSETGLSSEAMTESGLSSENITEGGLTAESMTGTGLAAGNMTDATLTSENMSEATLTAENLAGQSLAENMIEESLNAENLAEGNIDVDNLTVTSGVNPFGEGVVQSGQGNILIQYAGVTETVPLPTSDVGVVGTASFGETDVSNDGETYRIPSHILPTVSMGENAISPTKILIQTSAEQRPQQGQDGNGKILILVRGNSSGNSIKQPVNNQMNGSNTSTSLGMAAELKAEPQVRNPIVIRSNMGAAGGLVTSAQGQSSPFKVITHPTLSNSGTDTSSMQGIKKEPPDPNDNDEDYVMALDMKSGQTLMVKEGAATVSNVRRLYECTICKSRFVRYDSYRIHVEGCKKAQNEPTKVPLYMCSFCKKTFRNKEAVSQHFQICPKKHKMQVAKVKESTENVGTSKRKRGADLYKESLAPGTQLRCQDCDRTFSKERQYFSHVKKCTKISVHDMSSVKMEVEVEEPEEEVEPQEDPFEDPPPPPRKRGRPPGKPSAKATNAHNNLQLFSGAPPTVSTQGLMVVDNEGMVRSTTGLAHTVQLSLENASQEGKPQPVALVADAKGVRGRGRTPKAWSLVCSLCNKMFITKVALATHMVNQHGTQLVRTRNTLEGITDLPQSLLRCPLCSHHYQTENNFIDHLVLMHTNRLQETYSNLQKQTTQYVCSLCSLVLLTEELLMEHLSLVHLEELESMAQSDTHVEFGRSVRDESGDSHQIEEVDTEMSSSDGQAKVKLETEEEALECGFCGEILENQEEMVQHYVEQHGVEMDEDDCLLDTGIDIDIRVKDTDKLLQLADGAANPTLPRRTVLIRKKPNQTWQCKECSQVFNKHYIFLQHQRDSCTGKSRTIKSGNPPDSRFKCQEPGCSHLSFYQVKSLFKHMEEEHGIIVPREKRSFRNLATFNQWLAAEEKKYNVRYIRDTTRIERNNLKLIQMVCHRYHTAKVDNRKEGKDEVEPSSPSKLRRRWFVRIQRSSNCHARIHLKVQFNELSGQFDGPVHMIYYPQHTHSHAEHPAYILDRIMERHARDKTVYFAKNLKNKRTKTPGKGSTWVVGDGPDDDEEEQFQTQEEPSDQIDAAAGQSGDGLTVDEYMTEFCQNQIRGDGVIGTGTSTDGATGTTAGAEGGTAVVEGKDGTTLVIQDTDALVMEVDQAAEGEASEEYILPADEAEWTKLFDLLRMRLLASELQDQEKKEAEELLQYQNILTYVPLTQQVSIFHRLCSLTNSIIESTD
ncbi:uncharacterized protein LOC143026251 isoform X2 [Oratosquilla oratoria]|uniref:uncharacterized protein LOC143026251 isoform X2 n=1 Tax=Oratosquilla oratoria TaxID=337810 RepID=UPI003F76B368